MAHTYGVCEKGGEAAVQSARANFDKAKKDLDRTEVLAPMDGVVSLLSVKKGERVVGSNMMAGTEMLRIADMANIEIIVESLHALSNQNVDELKAAILDCRSRYFLLISEGKSH